MSILPLNRAWRMIVVTDYDNVCVSDETWQLCLNLYAERRLKPATIERRATEAAIAIATYVSKKAWAKGKGADVI